MGGVVVTAHQRPQPNYLPGLSVVEKVRDADAVVWLDEVQYTHGGWSNRNKVGGAWLTVPIQRTTNMASFNEVRISEHRQWRLRHSRTLLQCYGNAAEPLVAEIERNFRLLVGLNLACLRVLCAGLEIDTPWVFQSHLDGGSAVRATSDEQTELLPISERLAMMVEEVGGDVYLSGPSGRNYLSEEPFHERGIEVSYYEWSRENPCAVGALSSYAVA